MAYSYPTDLMNITSFLGWAMEVTDNTFGSLLLLAIFIVVFITFKNYTTDRAFGIAAFFCFVLGWLFRILSLIPDSVFILTILVGAGGLIWTFLSNRRHSEE